MLGIEVVACGGSTDGALLGSDLGTADGSADDGALFGMDLGADDRTSDSAVHGHATLVYRTVITPYLAAM